MMSVIEACPGITVRVLQARLSYQWSSFYLHLRRLEAAGLVRVEADSEDGRVRRIFPAGVETTPRPARPLVLKGVALDLARLVVARPGLDFAEVVAAMQEPPRSVHYHLRRLCDGGLVLSSSETRYRDLQATPTLEHLLRTTYAEPEQTPRNSSGEMR